MIKSVSDVNCILATPHRCKKKRLIHVTLLKMYHARDEQTVKDGNVDDTKDVAVIMHYDPNDVGNEQFVPVV